MILSGGSGSLGDKVKFQERVQWARRAVFGRGTTIIEKEKDGRELPLWIPQDPLPLQSGNQFYSQRLFLTKSVWENTKVPISQFQYPLLISQNIPCSCHHPIIPPTLIFLY